MILDFLLYIIYSIVWLITYPLRLLADITVESGFASAIDTATHYLANLNSFLPLGTILTIFSLILAIELIVAIYKIIMWIIRRIPSQS